MDILFALGNATTAQIREAMGDPPTGNAVRTLLQILEDKGHVRRRRQGREYLFSPVLSRARAGFGALQHVLETFFEGSIEKALTSHLTRKYSDLSDDEYKALMLLIEEARQKEK